MMVKTDLKEEWFTVLKNMLPDFSQDYKMYILDKVDELTDLLEDDISKGDEITSKRIKKRLEEIDNGMSGYQFDITLMLVHRYWWYSDRIIYKTEE